MRNRIKDIEHYLITNGILLSYLVFNNKIKQLKYYKLISEIGKCITKATTSCRDLSQKKKYYFKL